MISIWKKPIAWLIIATILHLFLTACAVTENDPTSGTRNPATANAQGNPVSDPKTGANTAGRDDNESTYARLGERLSPHTFSYTSDGDVISKEQATDLAADMLISEIPTLEKILLMHDDYFGDDYYGYKVNSWYMSGGDYGPDTYIEERVACIRPRGDEPIDGMFYNVEYYEYIDDESGTRMPIILSFAVLINKKVIIEDYVLNDEAAAEFEMYTKDAEPKPETISEPKLERDAETVSEQPGDFITIQGVRYRTNLTELCLSGIFHLTNTEIESLKRIPNLRKLDLSLNQIGDIGALAGLTNLTELHLQNNGISDLSPLAGLINLTELRLQDNQIGDIRGLAGLTNLETLYLSRNRIGDISSLEDLTNLKRLNMDSNRIDDIGPLAELVNLEQLHLNNNQIDDISALAGLTNLDTLHLNHNHIGNINALAGLTKLTDLWLYNNRIDDIGGLTGLKNLRNLWLYNNRIDDIGALVGLTNLRGLWLYNNRIDDISALAGLENLSVLNLTDNQIDDISPLAELTKPDRLSLEGNPIDDLSPVTKVTHVDIRQ
jgi:internalin A